MLKIKKKITNPMTVIAIFAAISETSAAISLPFLDNKDREIYVWFLISFPFYLLFLFFITLNFNYRSLYSPSDFDKDKNFLKVIDNNDRENKRNTSIQESSAQGTFGLSSCIVPSESGTVECKDSCRVHTAPDPPADTNTKSSLIVQHNIQLPAWISHLHLIDARDVDASKELATILENIRNLDRKTARVVVFLSNHVSDVVLTKNTLLQIRQVKKGSRKTLCIVYNLCSQAVTLMGRA
ncbi:hypothetical protein [Pseudomonas neuropathica]|uniref:hypothetical protein n=1 Tax=Pseudomonas neuropathica TaxID=2730425 RepID=UPI003EC0A9A1